MQFSKQIMDIRLSGMELDSEQRDIIDWFIGRLEKASDLTALHINVKEHRKAGGRFSYTVQLRAELMKRGKKTFEKIADETDWDFSAAVKKAFLKIGREVKSKEQGKLSRLVRSRKKKTSSETPPSRPF